MKKTDLPPAHLLPLVTTVERVYSETPTWLVATLLALAMLAVAAIGNLRETQTAQEECEAIYGATDVRCAK